MFRADLHTHTNCSDGTDDPLALLQLAHQVGLQGLSITDHDTIEAYTPELFAKASELGIRILPGIELSTELNQQSVHLLAYRIDLSAPILHRHLADMQERRRERNRGIVQKLAQRKIAITEEELYEYALKTRAKRTVGRPHIAQLLVQKGYVTSTYEAFERYLKEGASCYTSGLKYTPQETVELIHKIGGKAVLAHPHFLRKGAFLRGLLSLPFDGIECHYGNLHKELEKPWLQIAKERGWIATGGSDYHGTVKPNIPLGCSWVSEPIFTLLAE